MRFPTSYPVRRLALTGVLLVGSAASAFAADVEAGKVVFNRCKACHRLEANGSAALGPNLHGVFGRKAGTLEGYNYSQAMKNSGVVWDDATLTKYLADPKAFIPGDKMAFPGVKNDTDLANLLAYLKQATQ